MQMIRLPPGTVSSIIQIRDISALKDLHHEGGKDHTDHDLSDVCTFPLGSSKGVSALTTAPTF